MQNLSRAAHTASDILPYVAHTPEVRAQMLKTIGVKAIDDLFVDVPAHLRCESTGLPPPQSEIEVERNMKTMAALNLDASKAPFFCGAGCYRHKVPAAVDHTMQRSEWLTAYTPYQPEVSQGTLQALFEYETQVSRLLGTDFSNASMYDGSTACTEAILMALRLSGKKKNVLVSGGLHPHYKDTARTYLRMSHYGNMVEAARDVTGTENLISQLDANTAAVVVQNPTVFGHVIDMAPLAKACKKNGTLLIGVVTEPVSLGMIKSPGEMGCDIVVGEGQSLAGPMSFGGPHLGLFGCKAKFLRQMPGRLVGQTRDSEGKRVFVLTLGTREQHIRREKATSNICTSSGVMATSFSMHLSMLGEVGLQGLARHNHAQAVALAKAVKQVDGVKMLNKSFFNEFTVGLPGGVSAAKVVEKMAKRGVLGGVPASRLFGKPDDNLLIMAATEMNTPADNKALCAALRASL
uniref:glycine dehydrogenase (aminomethyl-transferring) n=1 Tax=Paratrimastix pyriformis TaxID=342808 RepID=B0F465_9EUKA|nr:glycine cleavage system protein P1 [Paratrimastix pyriformis]